MKAIQIAQNGGPEVLRLVEIPQPAPAAGEVLVRVHSAGVNFIDIYYREGVYKAALPLIPGQEGAGVVADIGPGVSSFAPGDSVVWCMQPGAYAEYAAVPASKLVRIPEGISFEQAAAVLLQGMTAQYLTTSTFALQPGNIALIHAAAGGVGLLLTQMAAQKGARVIATVSTPEKRELALAAGAHEVILYGQEDFVAAAKRITDGRGVDVVYDSVGKDTFSRSLECLRPRGMMVLFGASSGAVPPVDPILLSSAGSLFLTRPSLQHYALTREELDGRSSDVFRQVIAGKLSVRISASFALRDAAAAQQELQSRRSTGKLLLRCG